MEGLSRRAGSNAPLTPEEQAEYDTLVDRYAVRHGQPRAEIEDWFELRRAQERKAERQWGYVAGLLIVGVADLIPLVALALLVLSPSDVGELDGLAVAATLISTPLVLVGVGLVLDRLYSRLGRTNPDPMGLALIIAWVWAGLFLLMASRLVAWDDLLQASPLGSSRAAEVTLACGLDSAPRLTDRQGPRAVNA